ncbi:hypothetical protein ACJ4V0_15785 [Phreatobacter sp. HK31-P]
MATRTATTFDHDLVQRKDGLYLFPRWQRLALGAVRVLVAGLCLAAAVIAYVLAADLGYSRWFAVLPVAAAAIILRWRRKEFVGFWRGACPQCQTEIALPALEKGQLRSFHDCPACRRRVAVTPGAFEAF